MEAIVAIVGRPNVGKSTLFNRLIGQRLAIVEDVPGVTRDRLYGETEWTGHRFTLIDTGGIEIEGNTDISIQTKKQAEIAIAEADLILFMTDGKQGLQADDREIADYLRKSKKPVLLVVNKIDNLAMVQNMYDFYELGLGDPLEISAVNGLNIGDLLDEIIASIPSDLTEQEEDDSLKISFIGRPNVGKSSLINSILGEDRVIVSNVPGTTRDAIDTLFEWNEKKYTLIDTAGMRKKSKIYENVERFSVLRALRAVDRSDVVMMVLDAVEGVTEQDQRIAGYAHEKGRGIVLVVNKWDLVEKDSKTADQMAKKIKDDLIFVTYAPIVFVSALTGQRISRLLEVVDYVSEQQNLRLQTSSINDLLQEAMRMNPPPNTAGRRLKIYYVSQVAVKPPVFVFFVNNPELAHFSYIRYLENQIRATYGFEGTPIKLTFRARERS
jgi:GTP-binding protein